MCQLNTEVNFLPRQSWVLLWDGVIDVAFCLAVFPSFQTPECVFIFHCRDLSRLASV